MIKPMWDSKSSGNFDTDFDCFLAEALLSEGRRIGSQAETMAQYKAETLSDLAKIQLEKLKEYPKLEKLFFEIEMPLTKVLWDMEQHGILLDTDQLTKVGSDIDRSLISVQEKISRETGGGISINSPVQLGDFLAEKMGIPLGKTKTGRYATNEAELSKFADQFPIIADLLEYRELMKLKTTYVESLIQKVDSKGRIHTTYNQTAVNTGRLSSSNPNLQNIPVSSPIGLEIKSCFTAVPGHLLVSFDYSQQELRILAHLAEEKELIKAFENNLDVHRLTASRLFDIPISSITKEQRSVGKTINFGIVYGISSFGLSAGLHIPQEDAEKFIGQFYTSYPNIKIYYDNYLKNARIHGYVETILGRRRFVFEDPRRKFIDNSMRRVLMNYPVQGSAADLMRKGMVDISEKVLKQYSDVSMLLTIHDDLVFEVPDKDTVRLKELIMEIKRVLCNVYPLSIPLVVEVKTGKRWGDMVRFDE